LHLLFGAADDIAACAQQGLMLRHTVQFHWTERRAQVHQFRQVLGSLYARQAQEDSAGAAQSDAGWRSLSPCAGTDISPADWDFLYLCYGAPTWSMATHPTSTGRFFTALQTPSQTLG